MNLPVVLLTLSLAFALSGCNLLQSKEEQCLQSSRMQFKDPDSGKVIQNLGDRGHEQTKVNKGFWIRYSATNSYGARVSSNMACEEARGAWVRAEDLENNAVTHAGLKLSLDAVNALNAKIQGNIDARKACKTAQCRAELGAVLGTGDPDGSIALRKTEDESFKEARRLVFDEVTSIEHLK